MPDRSSYHAIYSVLNDSEFLVASLQSIYPHITGATVITNYDRDHWDKPISPDGTLELLLSREIDPERKVNVIVCSDESEPRRRNRAMALANLPRAGRRVVSLRPGPTRLPAPDYFWIVDADEIYEDADVLRLKEFVRTHRARAYLLWAHNYFRSWNWRVEEDGWYVAVVRPGYWFGHIRQWYPTLRVRLFQKLVFERLMPEQLAYRFLGARRVPRDVAVFHHGSYVGERSRIEAKLASSPHREEFTPDWLERVWDAWTPEMRNFHPINPERFPVAEHVPTSDLPAAIRNHPWPEGWLEPV